MNLGTLADITSLISLPLLIPAYWKWIRNSIERKWIPVVLCAIAILAEGFHGFAIFYRPGAENTNSQFQPSVLIGACQMRIHNMDMTTIAYSLREVQKRRISIVVEYGRKKTCPYAEDLKQVFEQAKWTPEPIQEREGLLGNGLWFHSPPADQDALAFYETLDRPSRQETHYSQIKGVEPNTWEFYIRDQWSNRTP